MQTYFLDAPEGARWSIECISNPGVDKREIYECTGFRDEAERRSRMQMDIEAPNTDEGENLHSQYVVQGVWLTIF